MADITNPDTLHRFHKPWLRWKVTPKIVISWAWSICFSTRVGSPRRSSHLLSLRHSRPTIRCSAQSSLLLSSPSYPLPLLLPPPCNADAPSANKLAQSLADHSFDVPCHHPANLVSPQPLWYAFFNTVFGEAAAHNSGQNPPLPSPTALEKQQAQMLSMGYSKVFTLGYLSVIVSPFRRIFYLRSINNSNLRVIFSLRTKPGNSDIPSPHSFLEHQKSYSHIIYDNTLLLSRAPGAASSTLVQSPYSLGPASLRVP